MRASATTPVLGELLARVAALEDLVKKQAEELAALKRALVKQGLNA